MDDSIKGYKQRRDARLKKRMDEEWITMNGTHVLIDDEGQVSKGPSTLKSLVEKSGGHKKKSNVTDLRKPGSANMNKGPNRPSAGKYMETLEKGGMKAKSPDDTKRVLEKNVGKGTIEGGIEDEKEDFWVREVRGKIEDCVKRVKEKTGYVKMWQELETDLYLVPDGTSVKVGDIVYTKGTDKYGDNGWLFTNEFGRKEGLVYNWTDGRFADEIARAIRGGKSSTIVVKQKGKSSEADIARERMIERGKNGGKSVEVEKSPDKPKKPTMKGCTAASDGALQEMGGRHWDKSTPDTDVWEFKGKVPATSAATNILNGLRKKGYDAVFTTASGKVSEKPTSYIWVRDPKNDYNFVEYSVYRSKDSSAPGKTYLSVDKKITY